MDGQWKAAGLLALLLTACGSVGERHQTAADIAARGGLVPDRLSSGPFDLAAWRRAGSGPDLTLYITGDGQAWADRSRPSPDPTPRDPLALRLAARDPAPMVAVLARPCQYRTAALRPQPACDDAAWWTKDRFAPAVIAAMDGAASRLKAAAGACHLHLVGFSGGAAIATLLAARRDDVATLRSVAGNLDPDWVYRQHGVSPLDDGSVSPRAVAPALAEVPQVHFVGTRDTVVPPGAAESFLDAMGTRTCARIVAVPADHHSGWVERWPDLLRDNPPRCRGKT